MIKISTKQKIGYRISDIGPGGKEYNIRTDKYYDEFEKNLDKVSNHMNHIKKKYKNHKFESKELWSYD